MDCGMKMSPTQAVELQLLITLIQTARIKPIRAQKRALFPTTHHPCRHTCAYPENTTTQSLSSGVTAPAQNLTSHNALLTPKQVSRQFNFTKENLLSILSARFTLCMYLSAGSTGTRASVRRGGSALSAQQKSRKELLLEKLREQLIKAKRFAVKMYFKFNLHYSK